MTTKIRFWQWPNVLATDASIIAIAWLWVFSREQSAELGTVAYAVLAMSVWLTYISDRLFDTGPREKSQLLSVRHQFTKRRARRLWLIWTMVLIINLLTAFTGLSSHQLQKGFVLVILCLAYSGLNHFLSKRFFPKELLVALIFTGGAQVFLPEYSEWPSLISFALLCLINCLCIGWKERSVDTMLQVRSISSILESRWLYPLAITGFCFSYISSSTIALLPSMLTLFLIQVRRKHYQTEFFRVLCDLALLIGPALYLLWSGVSVK